MYLAIGQIVDVIDLIGDEVEIDVEFRGHSVLDGDLEAVLHLVGHRRQLQRGVDDTRDAQIEEEPRRDGSRRGEVELVGEGRHVVVVVLFTHLTHAHHLEHFLLSPTRSEPPNPTWFYSFGGVDLAFKHCWLVFCCNLQCLLSSSNRIIGLIFY